MTTPDREGRRRAGAAMPVLAACVCAAGLLSTAVVRAQSPAQPQGPAQPAAPQAPATMQGQQYANQAIRVLPTPEQMTKMPAVLHLPGEDAAVVRRDLVYGQVAGQPLHFDLYLPPNSGSTPLAAIVFVSGASDARGWAMYQSYGRLAAALGFAGVVYEKRYERGQVLEGLADTGALLDDLRDHGREIGVDPSRIVLWGFSGGGLLLGVGIDARRPEVRALIGFYPVLDYSNLLPYYPDSLRAVLKNRASPADILQSRPLACPPTLIARAGLDDPLLNSGILRFLHIALENGRSIELINVPNGRHAFDVVDDTEESRNVMKRAFEFAKEWTPPAK